MSTRDVRHRAATQPTEPERNPLACAANGCPLPGTSGHGSGSYACHCHAYADAKHWPAITQALNEHRWLIDHLTELVVSDRRGEPIVQRATEYWHHWPELQPTDRERTRPSLYLQRLREELEHRVGARATRPKPRPAPAQDSRRPAYGWTELHPQPTTHHHAGAV